MALTVRETRFAPAVVTAPVGLHYAGFSCPSAEDMYKLYKGD